MRFGKVRGFTLIELMVVVAIVGMLAAIAIPSYTGYVIRSRIPDATSGLANKRVQMEQYFQDNKTYIDAPACNSDSTTSRFFTFSCDGDPTGLSYKLQAVGTGPMTNFTFKIDQANQKTTTSLPTGWTGNNSTCWVTRQSGDC